MGLVQSSLSAGASSPRSNGRDGGFSAPWSVPLGEAGQRMVLGREAMALADGIL